ncbi:MAG: nucleotidyl transferase AbiEii/AbiGii toxin family protein [Rectinemataceae bacterium]|nr:nucleotidyl transferase AbiEii/AbiGii toxin family protein [Rectinemataceae bacterium]
MAEMLSSLVERRHPKSMDEYDRALREVIQEFMLVGLWRGKFFEHAAFYGGTALRLLYGLDRFSENLDFSLLTPSDAFSFEKYFGFLAAELAALGLEATFEEKSKESAVDSAFMKTNTRQALISIGLSPRMVSIVPNNRRIKIKFEADTQPPPGFSTEVRSILEPLPIGIRSYTPACLFSSKFHALLARAWGNRVKGRDWYDLVFFVGRGIPLDLPYLQARLKASGVNGSGLVDVMDAAALLHEKIESLDIESAKRDVLPFVADRASIELWSKEFFHGLADRITACRH